MTNTPRICLLDMDGVMVNFADAAFQANGGFGEYEGGWNMWDDMGLSKHMFWGMIAHLSPRFWEELDTFSWSWDLLEMLEDIFLPENIYLCTTPTEDPQSAAGKLAWIQKHMPEYSRRYIITPNKYLLSCEGTVLIDDADHNIHEFTKGENRKGRAIQVPARHNKRNASYREHEPRQNPYLMVDYVERALNGNI